MEKKYDVLVVGGGIIGLSCAYYLLKEGKSVIVLEKGKPEDACSHANCGLISPSHALPLNSPALMLKAAKWLFQNDSPFFIRPQFNRHFVSWMLGFGLNARPHKIEKSMIGRNNLMLSSRKLYDELLDTETIDCHWSESGIMFAFQEEREFEAYAKKDEKLVELDSSLRAVPLVGEKLFEKEPALSDDLFGGWWYEIDASLKPDELVSGLKKLLMEQGVDFAFDTEVISFNEKQLLIDYVITNKGNYRADKFVLAAGAWSPLIAKQLELKLPVLPGKGYSITMKSPKFSPKMPCIMEEKKVVATPWNQSYRLGGTMEFAGYDSKMNKVRFDALKKAAATYMKDPYTDQVIEHWYGWRPMTNNGLPVIDFSTHHQNLLIACGHNMLGLSMATGTGKLVAELLYAREAHIDPSYYSLRGNLN